jgi:hypothetical protein
MRAQLTHYRDVNQYKVHFDKPLYILSAQTIWIDEQDITGLSRQDKRKFGVGLTYIVEVVALKRMKNGIISRVEVKMLGKKEPVKHTSGLTYQECTNALNTIITGSIDMNHLHTSNMYEEPNVSGT